MKKCKYCQSEIDAKAKICPHCKKRQGIKAGQIILAIIGLFVFIGIIGSLGNSSSSDSGSKTTGTTKSNDKFTLEDGHTGYIDNGGYSYYIEGYIKNNRDSSYSYVQVTFTTYDKDGNTIGTCLDNNSGLDANGRWKFKAMCLDDVSSIASYKLTDITGY